MANCTSFIQPLDLECIFINTFSESIGIFFGIAFILISYLAARFKMNGYAFFAMIVLFAIIMVQYQAWIMVLVVVLAAIMIYYAFSKIPTS